MLGRNEEADQRRRKALEEDLTLVFPEHKDSIPEMIELMDEINQIGVFAGYEAGYRHGKMGARIKLFGYIFATFFLAPFFLSFGLAAGGSGFIGLLIAAVSGTTLMYMLDYVITPKTKKDQKDED